MEQLLFLNNKPKKGEKGGPERAVSTAVLAWSRLAQNKAELEKWLDIDLLVVEGQQYHAKGASAAGALITLATNAGAAAALFGCGFGPRHIKIPTPGEWKGQLKKWQHHPRICKELGWKCHTYNTKTEIYTIPDETRWDFRHREWYDLLDAIGLALWGQKKLEQERKRQRR